MKQKISIMLKLSKDQIRKCQGVAVTPHPPDPKSKLSISDLFSNEQYPINGLRHPLENNTDGWCIWSGDVFSRAKYFIKPINTFHMNEHCPEILKILELPTVWRFLYTPDYADIWFDANLSNIYLR
jgi:hypothetical protein